MLFQKVMEGQSICEASETAPNCQQPGLYGVKSALDSFYQPTVHLREKELVKAEMTTLTLRWRILQVVGVMNRLGTGNRASSSERFQLSRSLIFCKLRWFIWLPLFRSVSSSLTTGQRVRQRRVGAVEWGSYDEPSLGSWQQLSQPLVLRGVQLIARLRHCHGGPV